MNHFVLSYSLIFHTLVVFFTKLKKRFSLLGAVVILGFFIGVYALKVMDISQTLGFVPRINLNTAAVNKLEVNACDNLEKNPDQPNTVVLRVDDFQAFSWTQTAMQMTESANQLGMPVVLGVIPINLDQDQQAASFLQKNHCQNEIALHGWDHNGAEYESLSYDQAWQKTLKGKSLLEQITQSTLTTFVPPENVISEEARNAVSELGFQVISTNQGEKYDTNVSYFDYQQQKVNTPEEVWSQCEKVFQSSANCVIMIHPSEFSAPDQSLDPIKFKNYLDLIQKIAAANVRVTTFHGLLPKSPVINSSDTIPASTWIADWDFSDTLLYVEKNQNIDLVMPFLYEVADTGEIKPINTKLFGALRDLPPRVKIMPTLVNHLDANLAQKLLENESQWDQQISSLVDELVRQNFIGLDLDIEDVPPQLQSKYLAFINMLSKQLHQNGLKLSVTVPIKNQSGNWKVADAYQWDQIAKVADDVRIMAYDVHNTPDDPGSIIPISDLKQGIEIALQTIPKEKIVFALPTYVYDWADGQLTSYQFSDLQAIRSQYQISEAIDPETQSVKILYTDAKGVNHEIWYESTETLKAKMELIKQSGIENISFWRLGNHDPKLLK